MTAETHYIYPETLNLNRAGRGTARALCGRRVRIPDEEAKASVLPTCVECLQRQKEIDDLDVE